MTAAYPSSRRLVPLIQRWLQQVGRDATAVEPLTGDVSLRRYFRAHLGGGGSAIVAYYPVKLRPVCARFLRTSELLSGAGVPVPAVLAADSRRGLMLLADSGRLTLYEEPRRPWPELVPVYRRATDHLERVRSLPRDVVDGLNTRLDASLLRWELRKTWDLMLAPSGLVGPPTVAEQVAAAFDRLCDEIGSADRLVPCHRDYMPRNLMLTADGEVVVLDHQDLRLGPAGYDLASLLNDSLFPPPEVEDPLVARALPGADGALAYRRATVQRSIKAVGTYCAFAQRGLDRHLGLVRPTLARAWRWFDAVPELAPLRPVLAPLWAGYLGDALLH
jgi:aminoglycoside/choline kinase family phosphotransferase